MNEREDWPITEELAKQTGALLIRRDIVVSPERSGGYTVHIDVAAECKTRGVYCRGGRHWHVGKVDAEEGGMVSIARRCLRGRITTDESGDVLADELHFAEARALARVLKLCIDAGAKRFRFYEIVEQKCADRDIGEVARRMAERNGLTISVEQESDDDYTHPIGTAESAMIYRLQEDQDDSQNPNQVKTGIKGLLSL